MGWGDRFISHNFVTIYWDEVSRSLRRSFPEIWKKMLVTLQSLEPLTHPRSARLEVCGDSLVLKDQLKEYADRGHELDDFSFLDYFLETYDGRTSKDADKDTKPSRYRSTRVPYLDGSGRKGCRIVRQGGHETMPRFVGAWFPRDAPATREYYCASMLALLCPWRDLDDLKESPHGTFAQMYERFLECADARVTRIIENINYFHECSDGARQRNASAILPANGAVLDIERRRAVDEEESFELPELSLADVPFIRANRWDPRDLAFGQGAMAAAREIGLFGGEEVDGCPMNADEPWWTTFQSLRLGASIY
ncbi:hypothetical protein R3P38DRAFT_2560084 [Favolaschia claudopus]|uniref:Uncharacterized protein n=1 Tax=Favolaschia claudopus TaxID=2862362 RepID=A0AAW0A5D7_9AGAR